jgi:hypothetical protein
MAMACTYRRPDATREAPAVMAVGIDRQLARLLKQLHHGVDALYSKLALQAELDTPRRLGLNCLSEERGGYYADVAHVVPMIENIE